jgi:hypothetical protein
MFKKRSFYLYKNKNSCVVLYCYIISLNSNEWGQKREIGILTKVLYQVYEQMPVFYYSYS